MPENSKNQPGFENQFGKPILAIMLQNINAPLLEIIMEIAKYFGWIRLSLFDVMSLLVLQTPNFWIGGLIGLFYGAWLGLFIYYSPKWLGWDHFPVKAMFLCMSQESWLFNIFGVLAHNELLTLSVRENFIDAGLSAMAGLIGGLLMQKFLFKHSVVRKGDTMKYDKTLLAMLFGIAPLPLAEGLTRILKYLGLNILSSFEILSLMWVKVPSWSLGILAMLGIGSWIGLIIYFSHKGLGTDFFILKAIILETSMLIVGLMIFGTLGGNKLLTGNAVNIVVHTFLAVIGGIITGFLLKKYVFDQSC